jgi:hypothetical protein
MSKIVVFFEIAGFTQQHYDNAVKELKAQGKLPNAERPSHVAFQKDDKWCVVDVWNSEEAFMDFGKNTLGPIFQSMGLNPPQPRVYPAHHFIGSAIEEFMEA